MRTQLVVGLTEAGCNDSNCAKVQPVIIPCATSDMISHSTPRHRHHLLRVLIQDSCLVNPCKELEVQQGFLHSSNQTSIRNYRGACLLVLLITILHQII